MKYLVHAIIYDEFRFNISGETCRSNFCTSYFPSNGLHFTLCILHGIHPFSTLADGNKKAMSEKKSPCTDMIINNVTQCCNMICHLICWNNVSINTFFKKEKKNPIRKQLHKANDNLFNVTLFLAISVFFCSIFLFLKRYHFFFREEQKHLKRASVVIGVIATVIFMLCVAMVAVTLHFTPVMNKFASKSPLIYYHKICISLYSVAIKIFPIFLCLVFLI